MRNEIGGEFDIFLAEWKEESSPEQSIREETNVPVPGENRHFVATGRQALRLALSVIPNVTKGHFLLPSYLCHSMIQPFQDMGIGIRFYAVHRDLSVDTQSLVKQIENASGVLVMSYFGSLPSQELVGATNMLREKGIPIIEDATHSMLSYGAEKHLGDIIVASLRKWVPIPDGAVVSLPLGSDPCCEIHGPDMGFMWHRAVGQALKHEYLAGGYTEKRRYLDLLSEAERMADSTTTPKQCSSISLDLLSRTDWIHIKDARRNNYALLSERLTGNQLVRPLFGELPEGICPLGFPLVTDEKQRDSLRQALIRADIYPPVHWKLPQGTEQFSESQSLSNSILTLPCDQRYDCDDMERISLEVSRWTRSMM